jgi:hypothetical protein
LCSFQFCLKQSCPQNHDDGIASWLKVGHWSEAGLPHPTDEQIAGAAAGAVADGSAIVLREVLALHGLHPGA